MTTSTGDRRPIATRDRPFWRRVAAMLAGRVSANAISVAGMVAGLLGGAALVSTAFAPPLWRHGLFVAAAAFIQLRLMANMLDGMVAIATGEASPVGELYNELPDRISDTAILVGAGYAFGGHPSLGWAAACVALFVTYIRALGKTMGVPGLFQGPMSKSHRMFTLTVACLYLGLAPDSLQPVLRLEWSPLPLGIMSAALGVIILGGVVTAMRRFGRIVSGLARAGDKT